MQTRSKKSSEAAKTEDKNTKTNDLVNNLLKSIVKENANEAEQSNNVSTNTKPQQVSKPKLNAGIRGKPKSGRPWKDVKQK